ncbi:MAG: hypothetical protein U1B80_04515 [Anaerolineaceae bacterium]|nr:hypothetical protein [Anaerolineaceae bacterium]
MRTGMLWFDNNPKTDLPTKISQAAGYFYKKYGVNPDLCFVHPTMMPADAGMMPADAGMMPTGEVKPKDIDLRTSRLVLPNHFWLGKNDLGTAHADRQRHSH